MSLRSTAERTFSSLANANYRKFFLGQSTSLVGTWMQSTAQSWLVLVLTHSATAIGVVVALQTLPVLLLGPYGGVIADRVDKRRLVIILQSLMAVQAAVLAAFTLAHDVTYLDVCVLAFVLGLNNSFENPSRQAFMLEMVGPADLRNAVSLNSTMNNAARAVGPAVAGVLIAAVGEGWCFVLNAVSFVAVVGSLKVDYRRNRGDGEQRTEGRACGNHRRDTYTTASCRHEATDHRTDTHRGHQETVRA